MLVWAKFLIGCLKKKIVNKIIMIGQNYLFKKKLIMSLKTFGLCIYLYDKHCPFEFFIGSMIFLVKLKYYFITYTTSLY